MNRSGFTVRTEHGSFLSIRSAVLPISMPEMPRRATVPMTTSRCLRTSLRALFETDLKRVLAYSTISALGILMLLFGMGTPETVVAGFAYLLAHACYKGAPFWSLVRSNTRLGHATWQCSADCAWRCR
jgi:NADH:ubiquinone oxidoreductase subunit 5 (subunit L)/multisubunit Na+/H+ antiporter MnhA subunit